MPVCPFPGAWVYALALHRGGWAKGFQEIAAMSNFHLALWIEDAAFLWDCENIFHTKSAHNRFAEGLAITAWVLSLAPLCPDPEAAIWEGAVQGNRMPKTQSLVWALHTRVLITRAVWFEGDCTGGMQKYVQNSLCAGDLFPRALLPAWRKISCFFLHDNWGKVNLLRACSVYINWK